jgi:hypothetical protein
VRSSLPSPFEKSAATTLWLFQQNEQIKTNVQSVMIEHEIYLCPRKSTPLNPIPAPAFSSISSERGE